jgi:hypothetical protein
MAVILIVEDDMFIREMLPRDRNEVIDECMRDRLIGRIPVGH